MTDLQLLEVKNSWSYLIFQPKELSQLFYNKLFELEPSLRILFKGDIEEQGHKLIDILTRIIARLQKMEDVEEELRALGQRHVSYGTKPEHYKTVEQALLWSIEHTLGSRWSEETSQAWKDAYRIIADIMMEGAKMSVSNIPEVAK